MKESIDPMELSLSDNTMFSNSATDREVHNMSNELTESQRNELIELRDKLDSEAGLEPDEDYVVTWKDVITAFTNYRKGVNYRRNKNKKDSNVLKVINKLPEETRKELMKKLGL